MTDKTIKVLLVDDEAQFRATTEKILQRKGFQTLLAANGQEALEKIAQKPDVVILDIKMPGMDGMETLRELHKRSAATPVIMLTGHGSGHLAQEALQHGASDFLAKPCDIDLLASKIYEACHVVGGKAKADERRVGEVMVPLSEYTTLDESATVAQAIKALRESFVSRQATDSLMETGHRSVLVVDGHGEAGGLLSIGDLMRALMPPYLSAPKPTLAEAIQYSPMFWTGMFSLALKKLADRPIGEIMSPAPPTISAEASLLEAAYLMLKNGARRLAVRGNGKLVGVVREQDLFFEMDRLLRA